MSTQSATNDRLLAARRWANDNAAVVLLACVVILALAANRLSNHAAARSPRTPPTHAWYYDTATKQIVTRPTTGMPTLMENGRELWLTRVFACGDCSQEPMEYYERCDPERRERWQELQRKSLECALAQQEESELYDMYMSWRQYSRDGVTWLPLTPEVEMALSDEFQGQCGETPLRLCHPPASAR